MGALQGKGDSNGIGAQSNVFVGNLPENMTQSNLERAFSPYGVIQSCVVMSKAGRTFGFVKFSTPASAARAIATLNGNSGWLVKLANNDSSGGDKGFGKGPAMAALPDKVSHSNVFVGNLQGQTKEELEQVFSPYGTVHSCYITTKGEQSQGFVEFLTIQEAER